MKVFHDPSIDYLSIEFTDEVEAKSQYHEGIVVRYNKKGNVIGIDIADSIRLFSNSDLMTLQEACVFLGVSKSTMRRRIKNGKNQVLERRKRLQIQKVTYYKIRSIAKLSFCQTLKTRCLQIFFLKSALVMK